MATLVLKPGLFVNNEYLFRYGNKEALFTIVDEEFHGDNTLGRVNRIIVLVRNINTNQSTLCTTVIGLGDGIVGIHSDEAELRGKLMTHENMERCVVELYEDE